jgi:uncharacterized protein (DUF433 family)
VVNEMLIEDLKMRRVRGIYFGDEFTHREPKVGGTGLGVWEVIQTYKSMDEDWEQFKGYYSWLDEFQLRMALEYYAAYPEEIDARIAENLSWTPEKLYTTYPFMRPPWVPDPRDARVVPETVASDR